MTRILSAELAPRGLRFKAIAATLVDAEGTRALGFIGPDGQSGRGPDPARPRRPAGRHRPRSGFLASDVAKFITGDVLFASAHFSKTDIANENQVEAAADSAITTCGRLDGVRQSTPLRRPSLVL
jgi:NAD(P)-dependent dehydrogenase (short-subunit alcohol dehydrogenase family)